jgi:hypothetical protein
MSDLGSADSPVTSLRQLFTPRHLAPQPLTFRPVRILVDGIGRITGVLGDRGELGGRFGETVPNHDRFEVQLWQGGHRRRRRGGSGLLLVLRVDDVGDVRQVGPRVALPADVQVVVPVLSIPRSEQLEERMNILRRSGGVVHTTRVRVRVADSDGLVEEEHVGVVGPRVRVVGRVDRSSRARGVRGGGGDHTRTELEEESGGRGTTGSSVQPAE